MASGSAGSIYVDLLLRDGNYRQGLNRARSQTKSATDAMSSSIKSMAASFASIFAAGAVFNRFIQNTINAQNEQAQLAAVLKSTGNAAGFTAEQLNRMSASMSLDSIFSSGQITNAQTRLLSYTGILSENIPRAMQIVIDQSARLGISLEQSAETIGRALESPSKAAEALSRQGFGAAFSKEVREMIKSLEQQGREAEAQAVVMKILEESYAGAAMAARDTLGGALIGLGNALNDLMTSNGGFPTLTKAINDFSKALSNSASGAGTMRTALVGLLGISIELYAWWQKMAAANAERTNFFGIMDDAVAEYTKNIQGAEDALRRLGDYLDAFNEKNKDNPVNIPRIDVNPASVPKFVDNDKVMRDLNSSYKRYEYLIRGVKKEVINLETAEAELEKLRKAGRISQEEMTNALKRYEEELKKSGNEMDQYAKTAAENIQNAFADFLFDPFENGLKGMAKGFIDTVRRMIAEAQAAKLARSLFGDLVEGGEGKGIFGDILGSIFGGFAGGFASGGTIPSGQWGIVGENGPELAFGGRTGQTIIPNDMSFSSGARGNVYNIDARGADPSSVIRIEQALMALAGPGVIEQRVLSAQERGRL